MFDEQSRNRGQWTLLTDLYELTMAYGYWKLGMDQREAVFHLTFRENPFGGAYAIACGLAKVCHFLDDFTFRDTDLDYLSTLTDARNNPLFDRGFLGYLRGLRLTCDLDAIDEGTVVFANEPLVRVRGPLLQAQLLESALLNLVNFPTLVATKAARICRAAQGRPVLEFGLRRAQGVDGALTASRAAFVGGCSGTSNVLAGRLYDVPVRGTHAHSWVMCFPEELTSFAAYGRVLPANCIFLVDTYDTIDGVRNAIRVAFDLRNRGHEAIGIRLDSGDLATLSRQARQMLDDAGLHNAKIVASNDLDEHSIASLLAQGAEIDIWGVGTHLVTAYGQPALGGVYKLGALRNAQGHWEHKVKLSDQLVKISTPGALQVRRFLVSGTPYADVLWDQLGESRAPARAVDGRAEPFLIPPDADYVDLLTPVYRNGNLVYDVPSTIQARDRACAQLDQFAEFLDAPATAPAYPVGLEFGLHAKKLQLIKTLERNRS